MSELSGQLPDHAGVRVPPPLLFLAPLVAGAWLNRYSRWTISHSGSSVRTAVGVAAVLAGVGIGWSAVLTFRRHRTTVLPAIRPTRTIVGTGPYRFTRNPMYVSLVLAYAGMALTINSVWPLVFLPFVVGLVDRYVIRREEAYLARKFGAEYDAYRRRVRRWL